MRAITRLGATIFLSCLSLVSIIGLLPRSTVSTRLQKIALGTTIDSYVPSSIWNWASGDASGVDDGVRLVVFGDSWVDDTIFAGEQKKGKVWVQRLCEEINCTSLLNFAVSQPLEAYPSAQATGTMLSNEIYSSHNQTSLPRTSAYMPSASDLLPDFAAQIQKFLTRPEPAVKPKETIFVVSFGMWDIYHYSGLDYSLSQSLTDSTIRELFVQLDILYNRYRQTVLADESPVPGNNTQEALPFRVIIPKLFDPTLLPGWVAQRPLPLAPSSASEQQKNAVYLTDRWNDILENKMGTFIKNDTLPSNTKAKIVNKEEEHVDAKEEARTTPAPSAGSEGSVSEEDSVTVRKDAFYYDLRKYLTDVIIEHQLEDAGLSDAAGLGTKGSPFESVYNPCVISADEEQREGDTEVNGLLVCKNPAKYLFWDDFRLGPAANEKIGLDIADMVRKGKSVRKAWQDGKKGSS